jgi:hypothetical protein
MSPRRQWSSMLSLPITFSCLIELLSFSTISFHHETNWSQTTLWTNHLYHLSSYISHFVLLTGFRSVAGLHQDIQAVLPAGGPVQVRFPSVQGIWRKQREYWHGNIELLDTWVWVLTWQYWVVKDMSMCTDMATLGCWRYECEYRLGNTGLLQIQV